MTSVDVVRLIPRLILATPFRLFAVYVSLFCAAVAAVFIYVNLAMLGFLSEEAKTAVYGDHEFLLERYREDGLPALANAITERSSSSANALYLLTDAKGHFIAGNLDTVSTDLWDLQGPAQFLYRRRENGQTERSAFGIVSRLPSDFHLLIARDIESQEALKRLLRRAFLLGYAFIIAIGAAGAVIVSRRMLQRVDAASNAARSIMQGNLAERIPIAGRNDEFDRLSLNLNAMLDRIQDLMAGLKNVSDNIAHDLKTPLHRLRTRAERALQSSQSPEKLSKALIQSDGQVRALSARSRATRRNKMRVRLIRRTSHRRARQKELDFLRGVLGSVIEEADTLIQTFDALLSIARLEAGSRGESFGPLNICALIADVADLYEPAAEERGLSLRLTCGGDVMMAGEKHLIGQALANLLDNAIKYALPLNADSPEETRRADVEIALEDKDETVDIVVADRGPGIPAADRERVLQRFVRLQPSRSIPGTGLGLSLVAAVARLHNGSVKLEDNEPGLRIRLTLKKNLIATKAAETGNASRELSHAS